MGDTRSKPVRLNKSKVFRTLALTLFLPIPLLLSWKLGPFTKYNQNANELELQTINLTNKIPLLNNADAGKVASPKAPLERIVFIKLRKVGGTTLQSILYRYAEDHKLTFVSPNKQDGTAGHISAYHITYEEYCENPTVMDPVFVVLLRFVTFNFTVL